MEPRAARELMQRLEVDAARIARRVGLRYRSLGAERAGVNAHYGICYDDGSIRIRLRHAVHGRPLKYSSLVNTLCHELAHLRHFDHGERFKALYLELLDWARREGIYRPGPGPRPDAPRQAAPPVRPGPLQLALFE
jgi:predicted metal-dependent hydrolase